MTAATPQLLLAGCGGLVAGGIWLVAAGPPPAREAGAGRRWFGGVAVPPWRWAVAVGAAAAAVLAVTRWPVAALLTAPAVLLLPGVLGPDRQQAAAVGRVEAVASWAEMLRDTLAAAAGLEQAILASEPIAPGPIATHVRLLGGDLRAGARLPAALDRFAADLADPTADLVVAALRLAAVGQVRDLVALLGALAAAAREQAGMRLRVDAARARTRTTVRVIVGTTAALAAVLVLANRAYLRAYDSATGQLVLLAIGGLFAGGLAWLAHMSRLKTGPRLLSGGGNSPRAGWVPHGMPDRGDR